jgi:transposase InsO family protein
MLKPTRQFRHLLQLAMLLLTLVIDALRFLGLCVRPSPRLAAENLFLRKQLALYQERHVRPRRTTNVTRITMIWLGRWFDWRQALAVVQPKTFLRWHHRAFCWFWRWKSTPGRPSIPLELQTLLRQIASDNPTWGQERIANELLLKLGLRVSPRTVRKYMPKRPNPGPGTRVQSQRWSTFVRNHARNIVACDFCVVVTATFRLLSVFVVMEHATRRILHINATAHPTARWAMHQLHEAIPADHPYRFLIHDRDAIFSQAFDRSIRHLGLRVLKTPPQAPKANAICERVLGTLRRECLDFMIPLTVTHLQGILKEWVSHYNIRHPHMALGAGVPQPPSSLPVPLQRHRHWLPEHLHVVSHAILGGLHQEYWREEKAA